MLLSKKDKNNNLVVVTRLDFEFDIISIKLLLLRNCLFSRTLANYYLKANKKSYFSVGFLKK